MRARVWTIILVAVAFLGLVAGLLYMNLGRSDRDRWEQWADSVVTVERDRFNATTDSLRAVADSIQSSADSVQVEANEIATKARQLRRSAEGLEQTLADAQTAADSVPILVAVVAELSTAYDSLNAAFDQQKEVTALLDGVIRSQSILMVVDSVRIASLMAVLRNPPNEFRNLIRNPP